MELNLNPLVLDKDENEVKNENEGRGWQLF